MESRYSLIDPLRDYFVRIFQDIKSMKALVLDEDSMVSLSLVISQSEILEYDVFMVETIDKSLVEGEKLSHLHGVCILRPTEENIGRLEKILASPKYGHYYLFFTNTVQPSFLQRLAAADRSESVKQVFEIFSDFCAVSHDLFSFNVPSVISLTRPRASWQPKDHLLLDRMVRGLFSVCLALRRMPVIRYQRSSEVAFGIAERLHSILREDTDLMNYYVPRAGRRHKTTIDGVDQASMVLILDRREDPVTPLLHQWTYQAMLHELLTLTNNRVSLRHNTSEELKNVALSSDQDQFYADNMFSNFGDLAQNINAYVENYQKLRQTTNTVESIEDMKRFIEVYPEFKKMAGNVSKHVTLTYELDHAIKERRLLDISEVEQEIACNENRTEHLRMVNDILSSPVYNHLDKLKLVLLYALRYERDEKIRQMKDVLRSSVVPSEQMHLVDLVDAVIQYAGTDVRSCDLFSNKSFLAKAKNRFTSALKNVPNMYTQHQSYLSSLLDQIAKGKLKEADFPGTAPFNPREKVTEVIVFVVGGTTYEEAKEVGLLNKSGGDVHFILGGNYVHNSVSFLAELSQLLIS